MKHITILFSCLVLFAFTFFNSENLKSTEVTITVPNLTTYELANQIKNEIKEYKDMEFVEGSLETKTLVLRVNESSFNKSKFDKILFKWGCTAKEYYFRKLYSLEIN